MFEAIRELHALAVKPFSAPGEPAWPLGTLFAAPASRTEADSFKAYFKQARDETGARLVALVFEDGTKSKWWQVINFSFSFISINNYISRCDNVHY
jgi:actin related protein 2/3 complex subunit 3